MNANVGRIELGTKAYDENGDLDAGFKANALITDAQIGRVGLRLGAAREFQSGRIPKCPCFQSIRV